MGVKEEAQASYLKHAGCIVVTCVLGVTFGLLVYNLFYDTIGDFELASVFVLIAAPTLLVCALVILKFIKRSLEKFTLRWCLGIVALLTIIDFWLNRWRLRLDTALICSTVTFAAVFYYYSVDWLLNRSKKDYDIVIQALKLVCSIILCTVVSFATYDNIVAKEFLAALPKELNISKVTYRDTMEWGFKPSGAESGVILYALPERTIAAIRAKKTEYLENTKWADNTYSSTLTWYETPISVKGPKLDLQVSNPNKVPAESYIYSYFGGYSIQVDENVEKIFTQAVTHPGSFYAYGLGGIILISPDIKTVIHVYHY
ncbi:MAG: hypothetical protein PW788_12140 [Micavibrio sp.]|nr:hypothetical protein [Micavibrio sp.]